MANLLALLIGTVVATIAVEIIARMFFPAPLQWYLPQNLFEPSPSLGFRYRPSQDSYTADKPFRTSSMGLRGPERPWEKPPGVQRVLVLGDSIAMGFGVREEDTFSALLERDLNRVAGQSFEVINAGVAAYSTKQEVEYFVEDGRKLNPDVVIIALYWNDVAEKSDVRVSWDGVLVERGDAGEPSALTRLLQSRLGYGFRNALKRSRALHVASFKLRQILADRDPDPTRRKQLAVLEGIDDPEVKTGWHDIEAQLRRLSNVCSQAGIKVLVIIVPMPQQVDASFPRAQYQSVVREICARQSLLCVDPLPAFQVRYHGHESLFIPYDGDHPNEHGHELLATELLTRVLALLDSKEDPSTEYPVRAGDNGPH